MKRSLVGPIILAGGLIGATAVSRLASESGWLVLSGPLVMAISVVIVGFVDQRLYGGSRRRIRVALVLGAVIVLAGVIMAWHHPDRLAKNMWLYGGLAAAVMWSNGGKGSRERERCEPGPPTGQ